MRIKCQYDGEDLGAAEGLLVAVAQLLDPLTEGESLELLSSHPTVADDLRIWCRRAGHRYAQATRDGAQTKIIIERGFVQRTLADPAEWGVSMIRREGGLELRDWRVGRNAQVLDEAPPLGAFAPRGASLEAGASQIEFSIRKRADIWADSISELYQQSTANQWQGARDIPWAELKPLNDALEKAVCQIMTFLAENEYAALYVPARFLGQIHPHFTEVTLFLSVLLADEARHIEVFTKRALANGGGLGMATAATQLSLASLLEPKDFSIASFLLSVLGEGTFLDLLAFLEEHAPEPTTREICRRARLDESRHVHFGIAHARYSLEADKSVAQRFGAAVKARAEFLKSISGVGALIEEALIIYAGGSLFPAALRSGTILVKRLYETMHTNRMKRLATIGFDLSTAEEISGLHTPNFM